VSQRRACRVLEQPRSSQRYVAGFSEDERLLVERIVALATEYGRYGYRRITALLRREGWRVNHKRVERLWRQEGLKVPQRQPKRGRLWLNDGSCIRLRPECRHQVWSYDFLHERTHDGRPLRLLTVIDEYSRASLAIEVARKLNSQDVLRALTRLFVWHWDAGVHSVRQRAGVYGEGSQEVAGSTEGQDSVYRAGQSLGERLQRVL